MAKRYGFVCDRCGDLFIASQVLCLCDGPCDCPEPTRSDTQDANECCECGHTLCPRCMSEHVDDDGEWLIWAMCEGKRRWKRYQRKVRLERLRKEKLRRSA